MDVVMKWLKEELLSEAASKRELSASTNGGNSGSTATNGGTPRNEQKPVAGTASSGEPPTRTKADAAQVLQALARADAQHALKHTPQPGGQKTGR